jgi:predicted O-methyltransferase YrrM
MHSPFVYDFIEKILRDKKQYPCYNKIESIRKNLLKQSQWIAVDDFGAGSAVIKNKERKISAIAKSSLKPSKFAQLFFRMVQYYQPRTILELGTSFGISTAYLASGNEKATVITCEGAPSIAKIANDNFKQLGYQHIQLIEGDFNDTLPLLLQKNGHIDFAFIDGNHRKIPTLNYFQQLLKYHRTESIFIFDDIHWSNEMENAWETIRKDPSITCSIDLFLLELSFSLRI